MVYGGFGKVPTISPMHLAKAGLMQEPVSPPTLLRWPGLPGLVVQVQVIRKAEGRHIEVKMGHEGQDLAQIPPIRLKLRYRWPTANERRTWWAICPLCGTTRLAWYWSNGVWCCTQCAKLRGKTSSHDDTTRKSREARRLRRALANAESEADRVRLAERIERLEAEAVCGGVLPAAYNDMIGQGGEG